MGSCHGPSGDEREAMARGGTGKWRQLARTVASTAIVLILVAFVLDNPQSVRIGFIVFERQAPLIWVLLVTAVLGAVADLLLRWRARGPADR
jgi:uncharacterized integral membrane protein